MRVLVACEFSGAIRRAMQARGHDAWSCDLLPPEDHSGKHFQCDVRKVLGNRWDMMIGHPPCFATAVSGARWFKNKRQEQADAIEFFRTLWEAPIPRICLEHPVSVISTAICPPTQWVHPYFFGTPETKKTGLWLKGLPPLTPTNMVAGRKPRVHYESPGPDRWKRRSRTDVNMAAAMAAQWGCL